MKKFFTILLGLALVFSMSTASFANENHEVTFDELMELATKYNFEPVIVDESLSEKDIVRNLTKDELENLIIKTLEENSKPLHFEEVYVTFEIPSSVALDESIDLIAPLSTWKTAGGVKTLSRTDDHMGEKDFRLKKAVSASYEFEYQPLPGEPDPTRNWRFTGVDDAGVVHLNPGAYQVKKISSSAKVLSDTGIRQEFSGVVNVGFYTVIGGVNIRVPIADNDFSGSVSYSISQVQ
ncbi:hypothetical protein KQI88_17675 [Alkaliphilus sp. MSJ-5]|uniref:Uncharacterized protein n=1 Tax=Alkaliphilus flagellatus TaxID=2841507 RepID=A0ABS6GA51_9FIRM|nr:hypothetical protein [Alkaliphilus flagellatus]MBU5678241.1 hypothetical protein [Alkaliphilus flagellatus]